MMMPLAHKKRGADVALTGNDDVIKSETQEEGGNKQPILW